LELFQNKSSKSELVAHVCSKFMNFVRLTEV